MTGDPLTRLCERLEQIQPAQRYQDQLPTELPAPIAARLARAATALAHSEAARDPFMRGDSRSAYALAVGITLTARALRELLNELAGELETANMCCGCGDVDRIVWQLRGEAVGD